MPAFARLSCATLMAFFIATEAQPSDLHAQVSALLTRVEDLEGQLMARESTKRLICFTALLILLTLMLSFPQIVKKRRYYQE